MSSLILYTSEDGQSRIQLRNDGQTVWLSQLDMAELLQTTKQNIAKHLKAIFADGELRADSVVNPWLTTAADGKNYRVAHYNLDPILAVGYRVRELFALSVDYDRPRHPGVLRHSAEARNADDGITNRVSNAPNS